MSCNECNNSKKTLPTMYFAHETELDHVQFRVEVMVTPMTDELAVCEFCAFRVLAKAIRELKEEFFRDWDV